MRTKMPRCAAFVDALREAFGVEEISNVIKRGLRPEAKPEHRVHFSEAGHTLGHVMTEPVGAVGATQMVIGEQVCSVKRGRR